MPFKSKKQHRYFRYMESKGEIPKGTSNEWMDKTKDYSNLPEKKASFYKRLLSKIALRNEVLPSGPPLKQIYSQKERLDEINNKKRMGLTPVEYRNLRKNKF